MATDSQGTVLQFRNNGGKLDLLDAYRKVIADGYNQGRTYNQYSVQVMIGLLCGAFVALRVVGNESWALRFESAGQQLQRDWKTYPAVVQQLCADIDQRQEAS